MLAFSRGKCRAESAPGIIGFPPCDQLRRRLRTELPLQTLILPTVGLTTRRICVDSPAALRRASDKVETEAFSPTGALSRAVFPHKHSSSRKLFDAPQASAHHRRHRTGRRCPRAT